MAKEQDDAARAKQIEENRRESAEAARKQLGIPKKKSREESAPTPSDNSNR
jgi:hypothetical protein